MTQSTSLRQILRSSSIIGGASVLNILFSLVRIKVAAVLLGPAGVGLIGLYTSLMATASSVAGLGFGNVGTRQIAEAAAREDGSAVAAARRALFWGTLVLSLIGAALFWLLREPLAGAVLSEASQADNVGWLALGVALTVAGASQGALLSGLRRIGDLARVSVLGGILGAVLGVAVLWNWGEGGVLAFVLAGPLASFLLGQFYVSRLPKVGAPPTPLRELFFQWRHMARLGAAFMLAGVVSIMAPLVVRTLVQHELGDVALGHFQAAWLVSMTYLALVLQAMGADYYPRLTGVIERHDEVNRMANQQTEVALILAGPILLAMLGFAPWVIELLYSDRFLPAVELLRWQVLGDVLKVASWPLAYIILAAGDGRTFLISESISFTVLPLLTWVGMPWLGLQATGIAFVAMYTVYLPLVYWLARRRTGFRWVPTVRLHLATLVLAALAALIIARWSAVAGALLGALLSAIFALYGLGRLAHLTNLGGPLGRMGAICRKSCIRLGLWRD